MALWVVPSPTGIGSAIARFRQLRMFWTHTTRKEFRMVTASGLDVGDGRIKTKAAIQTRREGARALRRAA
jgi:hypothetical protein